LLELFGALQLNVIRIIIDKIIAELTIFILLFKISSKVFFIIIE